MSVTNKNNLIICELHNPVIHGKTDYSDPNIENHYLVYDKFDGKTEISLSCIEEDDEYSTDEEYDSDEDIDEINRLSKINDTIKFLRRHYKNFVKKINHYEKHPTIRNYSNIISRKDYIRREIGECILLPTQETIAILKTFWIRIIQKKWKKVFKEREIIIKKRNLPSSLYKREIIYNWYNTLSLPGLKGMLYNLSKKNIIDLSK
jgi:hypothetical protein